MAESVKRRVAAARLAVAFVAAGTIAGASAWAQADPAPPTAVSSASGQHIKKATLKLTTDDIVDGSLLFKDFKKHEVPSYDQFIKFEKQVARRYYPKIEIDKSFAKLTDLNAYIKLDQADARYMKIGTPFVNGDGHVFTASKQVGSQGMTRLADVPNMFTVDAQGPTIRITNTSGQELLNSSCPGSQGQPATPAGSIAPGGHIDCFGDGSVMPIQLISAAGAGGGPLVSTVNFSSFSWGANVQQSTVQILVGL